MLYRALTFAGCVGFAVLAGIFIYEGKTIAVWLPTLALSGVFLMANLADPGR